jgi:hypothetical protein
VSVLTQSQKEKQVDSLTDDQYKRYLRCPKDWSHKESFAYAKSHNNQQVRTSKEDTEKLNKLYYSLQNLMDNLSGRWISEGGYEDIAEYQKVLEKAFTAEIKKNAHIVKMTKKPFGFVLEMNSTGFRYKFTCSSTRYLYARVN